MASIKNNLDIILLSTPVYDWTESDYKKGNAIEKKSDNAIVPAAAIFHLKGNLNKNNFSSLCLDFNLHMNGHFAELNKWEDVCLSLINRNQSEGNILHHFDIKSALENISEKLEIDKDIIPFTESYIIEKIKVHSPKFIGISVFSTNSQKITVVLCTLLRKLLPDTKIILGGCGLGNDIGGERVFGKTLLKHNLADFYISGDGEISLVELLKGNISYNGINSIDTIHFPNIHDYDEIDDLDSLPFPDWSDLVYGNYKILENNSISLAVTGSRGCVRNCSFCDVAQYWHKFRFRSGENIAKELIRNKEEYGVISNHFTDSLINGSMKAFRNLCGVLTDYHENLPQEEKIIWGGQFIARPANQQTENDYNLMQSANLEFTCIGVESGSESVRHHMGKKFTNKDLYFTIEQLAKKDIKMILLFIVGYPTETERDFYDTVDLLNKYNYLVPNTIIGINAGYTAWVINNTPLYHMSVWEGQQDRWVSSVVDGLNWEERNRRQSILTDIVSKLGVSA